MSRADLALLAWIAAAILFAALWILAGDFSPLP